MTNSPDPFEPCEFCDLPGIEYVSDNHGNEVWVCENHSISLSERSAERQADVHYSDNKE